MPFIRKWITSGSVKEAEEYFALRTPKSFKYNFGNRPLRGKNSSISSEQQQKLNNRNAVKHIGRLINNNYTAQDLFLSLDLNEVPYTESGEVDEKAIKKTIMERYIRILRRKYKKAGKVFKYIYVIEKETLEGPVRAHVHMLIPNFSFDEVVSVWSWGGCCIRRLDANKDYRGIANYMSKDPTLGMNHQKRWCASKNIIQPTVKCEKITYPGNYIKPPKGFKVIIDCSYASDITGLIRYVRYIKVGGQDFAGAIIKETKSASRAIPIKE